MEGGNCDGLLIDTFGARFLAHLVKDQRPGFEGDSQLGDFREEVALAFGEDFEFPLARGQRVEVFTGAADRQDEVGRKLILSCSGTSRRDRRERLRRALPCPSGLKK
jgi:hypothetical protein